MSIIRIVADREIRARVRAKSFWIGLAAMVIGTVAGLVVMDYVTNKTDEIDIAVVSAQSKSLAEFTDAALGDSTDLKITTYDGPEAAIASVEDGEESVALVPTDDGWELLANTEVPASVSAVMPRAISEATLAENAAKLDVQVDELKAGSQVSEKLLDPDAEGLGQRQAVAFVMALLFYLVALIFGMQIAQNVVNEKESRVVEILAAAVSTRALLWGKIIGNSFLALAHVAAMVVAGITTMIVLGNEDLLSGVGPAMGWYVAFFGLGFVALAALWSAGGALASRTEDVASTTMPLQFILLGGYLIGSIARGSSAEIVASYIPVISAIVMPTRIAVGGVAGWEILIALALNVVAAYLLTLLGARIYDRSLMQTNRKMSFKEALRSPKA